MINKLLSKYSLQEGKDFIIQEKNHLTFYYFNSMANANSLRREVSNHAILKNIHLYVISDVLCRNTAFGYYFFVSKHRFI
jgi:hypothetical protein